METRDPRDEDHGRRWRRRPFAPASFQRPNDGHGRDGHGGDPRRPEGQGGGFADPDRPPSQS